VRGYELEDGSYVTVTDDELEDLEPQKTRDIDLREFVDLREVAPVFFERGYFLAPDTDSTKAYRLLAGVMEKTGRAGIATFVMRGREDLVAIFAEHGILCAETLRFHDEVCDPQAIGLPEPETAPRSRVSVFEKSMDSLFTRTLSRELLADPDTERLRALVEKKQRAGKDVVRLSHETRDADANDEPDVDLLDTIRRSLRHASTGRRKLGSRRA